MGPDFEKRIEKFILCSGGYPREILQYLQRSIAQTEYPLPDDVFRGIIQETSNAYRDLVPENAFEWLAKVGVDKFLTLEDDDHRKTVDLMLQNHAVLRYLNDDLWFDLHPAVRRIPGVREKMKSLQEER